MHTEDRALKRNSRTKLATSGLAVLIVAAALGGASLMSAQAAPSVADAPAPITDSSKPIETEGGSFLAETQMDDAWEKDVESFPLDLAGADAFPDAIPDAITAPDEAAIARAGEPVPDFYEVGTTAVTAGFYWACSWENEYLAAEPGSARQTAALDELAKFKTIPAIAEFFVDVDVWYSIVIEPAYAGDQEAIRTDFPRTCSTYIEETAK